MIFSECLLHSTFRRHLLGVAILLALPAASAMPSQERGSPPSERFQVSAASRGFSGSDSLANLLRQPTSNSIIVQNCNDAGGGSLRQALLDAVDGTAIDLSQLSCSTISLSTGALQLPLSNGIVMVNAPYRLEGGRRLPTITIDAQGQTRVVENDGGAALELVGLYLEHGQVYATDAKGGCVTSSGTLAVYNSTLSGCYANGMSGSSAFGGAIYSSGLIALNDIRITSSGALSDGGYVYGGAVFARAGLNMQYGDIEFCQAFGIPSGVGYGGGLDVQGSLTMGNSVIAHNVADYDGGIGLFSGDSIIVNSTIADNKAYGAIGGIESNVSLQLKSSTIAGNVALGTLARGGGIQVDGTSVLTLTSSIVSGNLAAGMPSDLRSEQPVAGSNDLIRSAVASVPADTISGDPLLGPLQDNGGHTPSMALPSNSPAINRGLSTFGAEDQRGVVRDVPGGPVVQAFERSVGSAPDIGAYEYGAGDVLFADGFEQVFNLLPGNPRSATVSSAIIDCTGIAFTTAVQDNSRRRPEGH